MPNAVVFAGAGLSKPFGLPLLKDIFTDTAVRDFLACHDELLNFLISKVWEPNHLTIETSGMGPNIEDIYNKLQPGQLFAEQNLYGLEQSGAEGLSIVLRCLVFHAIYIGKSSQGWKGLNSLIEAIEAEYEEYIWATFNWDCLFEACYAQVGRHHRGSPYRNPKLCLNLANYKHPDIAKATYLKLHGGINWWFAPSTETIEYVQYGNPNSNGLRSRWENLESGTDSAVPVILHPWPGKYDSQNVAFNLIKHQWDHLFQAERDWRNTDVYFLGYSCPPTDSHAMALLEHIKIRQPRQIWVHYYSQNDRDSFFRILGDAAHYSQMDFCQFDPRNGTLLAQIRARENVPNTFGTQLFEES